MTRWILDILHPTERDKVERWRAGELGVAPASTCRWRGKSAARVRRSTYTWPSELIANGCPPELAARILSLEMIPEAIRAASSGGQPFANQARRHV